MRGEVGVGDQPLALDRRLARRDLGLAQALEHRVPHAVVGGEVGVMDMRRQHRPHRDDVLAASARACGRAAASGASRLSSMLHRRRVEPGADIAAIFEFAIHPAAERQRAEPAIRRRLGVADDREVARLQRLGLEPGLRALLHVGRVVALGDDAFEPQLRRLVVEHPALAADVVGELDRRLRPGDRGEQRPQQLLALDQRHARSGRSRRDA